MGIGGRHGRVFGRCAGRDSCDRVGHGRVLVGVLVVMGIGTSAVGFLSVCW